VSQIRAPYLIERESDSEEVDFDVDQLLQELPDVDLQLDSDPVNPASPLQVDTAPNARLVQDLTSSPTHPKATKPTFVVATNADLQRFLDNNKNRNTTKTTATWVNFKTWRNVKITACVRRYPRERVRWYPTALLCRASQTGWRRVRTRQSSYNARVFASIDSCVESIARRNRSLASIDSCVTRVDCTAFSRTRVLKAVENS